MKLRFFENAFTEDEDMISEKECHVIPDIGDYVILTDDLDFPMYEVVHRCFNFGDEEEATSIDIDIEPVFNYESDMEDDEDAED